MTLKAPRRVGRSALLGATLCAAIIMLPGETMVRAHEIGTTRVSVVFHEGRTFDIEIVTDAAALADKLEPSAGQSPVRDHSAAALQALIPRFEDTFRRRVRVAIDGAELRPDIAYAVRPGANAGSSAVATIRLTGAIRSSAGHFTWSYGWTFASYALMLRDGASGTPTTEWLEGGQTSTPFRVRSPVVAPDRPSTAWRYLTLGFTHILPNGLDHILFVLGIYLLSGRARSVLSQVTAFTIAHSITLALSMYGVIAVSPRVVEPLIAISIAYVAIENLFLTELNAWRIALVFAFGLLHGMGFAGALRELGLPRSEFLTALLTFNVGVEMGQLAVIATAFLLVGYHCANRAWYRSRIVVPASALIACAAAYWTFERLAY